MQSIVLENISHKYGDTYALQNVSLEIKHGELFTLLGPSGCGKTTMLRIIAGFLQPTAGSVIIDGEDITRQPPEKRGMGVVFQNYALFPNMTVEENIAYGLRLQKLDKAEIEKRCDRFLALTGMEDYRSRKIDALSGGQQQRVAIARALIISPRMLLLDEPMSNLDVALRARMRQELQDIQRQTGVTTLFITHDQQEALGISQRIAVMDHGTVQQVGSPRQIYDHPENEFVAQFVGTINRLSPADAADLGLDAQASRLVRPEQLVLSGEGVDGIPVIVDHVLFDGSCCRYTVKSANDIYRVVALNRGDGDAFSTGSRVYMRLWNGR
ncbi:MAG: ABC transporter ATP-binding protein [Clostridia bacterium]|nr:ABC transporter ATP-binding protein [Clostridia bacterium]